ncbi:MAG: VOC family protein [Ornithinimicrobium sp.]|nr:VOC family protein [Ornithinimicrobium sp.]
MSTVTVDSEDAGNLATFWAAVLDWEVGPGATAEFAAIGGARRPRDSPSLMFVRVPEAKAGRNRWHLDLSVEDLEGEVERLVGLGARLLHRKSEDGATWVTLGDPEGNEFCVAAPHELTSEIE